MPCGPKTHFLSADIVNVFTIFSCTPMMPHCIRRKIKLPLLSCVIDRPLVAMTSYPADPLQYIKSEKTVLAGLAAGSNTS